MSRLVKNLRNNRCVIFDAGRFDDWCVYVVENGGYKTPPLDMVYFEDLSLLSKKYPKNKVYDDFVSIYDRTTSKIEQATIDLIDNIVESYNQEDQDIIEQWFTVLYAGMIAEENKEHAILKKRVKRLGMYQVLILNNPAVEAAKFSYNKNWRDLDTIMKRYGF